MITKEQYKILKQLCNQYEHKQRKEKQFKIEQESIEYLNKYVDLYYNGYYLYALDKTENRPDEYLTQLIKKFGHLNIILDLTTCNSFRGFNGKEVYLIESGKQLKYIKFEDLDESIYNVIREHRK